MIRWVDGAEMWGDLGTYHARAYVTASSVTAASPGRVTPGLRYLSVNGGALRTPSLGAATNWTIGFGFFTSNTTSGLTKVRLFAGATEQCRLEIESDGSGGARWKLIRGSTTIATSPSFALSQWFYFELQVDVTTSGANYELRQNEQTILSGSSANLANAGSNGADAFGFEGSCRFDDIYILDDDDTDGAGNTTFRGDSVEFEAVVEGNGHEQDWTRSTGSSNVANVDDLSTSASSADYNHSDTTGDEDYYTFADLPSTGIGTIFCVKVSASLAMAGTGNRTVGYKFYDASLVEHDIGDPVAVAGTQIVELPVFVAINPDTSSLWTKSDLDAGEIGVQVKS
jgi:hypothetical protein